MEKKEKTVIDGNAFYEIDMECVEKKKQTRNEKDSEQQKKREQRD